MNAEILLEIKLIKERLAKLEGKKANQTSETSCALSEKILKAVEDKAHPLICVDLVSAKGLAVAMHELHPDELYFDLDTNDGKSIIRAARAMGSLLGRTKIIPKLLTRLYVPAHKPTGTAAATHNVNVWVMRNLSMYKDMRPVALYAMQQEMWRQSVEEYNNRPSFF